MAQLFLEDVGGHSVPPTSPLSFTGAKHRLFPLLTRHILPVGTSEIVSPFMGGASLELKLAAAGVRVHAYDIFRPIVEFYQVFNEHAPAVVEHVLKIFPIYKGDPATYEYFKELVWGGGWEAIESPIERAAVTWAVSKQSFMGKNFASTPIKPEHAKATHYFTRDIGNGLTWADWHVENITFAVSDYRESLARHDCIAYLDPPYVKKAHFYGKGKQGEFPHVELRDILSERQGFVLSYGDHPLIRELYSDFKVLEPQWVYRHGRAAGNAALSEELLILSHDVASCLEA